MIGGAQVIEKLAHGVLAVLGEAPCTAASFYGPSAI